jgi:hypothetical protein
MPGYLDLERSGYGGRPQEFYHFFRAGEDWRLTPGSITVVLMTGEVYSPEKMSRSSMESGGPDAPGSLSVTIPTTSALADAVLDGRSDPPIELKLYEYHRSAEYETVIIFWGEVVSFERIGKILKLECAPLLAQGDMIVPRGLYQKDECAWNPFDLNTCKVNPAIYTYTADISDINGLAVTVPGAATFGTVEGNIDPKYFAGGVISRGNRRGMIEEQFGDVMILQNMVKDLIIGDTVSLLAGDDRSPETCLHKYNNIRRNMSFKEMPVTTPWFGQGMRP